MALAERVVLLGAPGSGKGTQAERLAQRCGYEVISTGVRLRKEVESGSPLGKQVAAVMASGKLVADELMIALVKSVLNELNAGQRFILDGFPRTIAQATALHGVLAELRSPLDRVIYLEVPEEELVRRLVARGRQDDDEAVVRERLRVFAEATSPLVAWYEERSLLRRVFGLGPVAEVTGRIVQALEL